MQWGGGSTFRLAGRDNAYPQRGGHNHNNRSCQRHAQLLDSQKIPNISGRAIGNKLNSKAQKRRVADEDVRGEQGSKHKLREEG